MNSSECLAQYDEVVKLRMVCDFAMPRAFVSMQMFCGEANFFSNRSECLIGYTAFCCFYDSNRTFLVLLLNC